MVGPSANIFVRYIQSIARFIRTLVICRYNVRYNLFAAYAAAALTIQTLRS